MSLEEAKARREALEEAEAAASGAVGRASVINAIRALPRWDGRTPFPSSTRHAEPHPPGSCTVCDRMAVEAQRDLSTDANEWLTAYYSAVAPEAPCGGRVGDWFQTFTGRAIYPLDPRPEEIAIEDIAHHLANQCRYNGATREFYSVAQHSVLVSMALPDKHAFWGLMHDAAEAYTGDMVRPLKLGMPQYREVEERMMRVIAAKFGLPWPEPPAVKLADNRALMTERRDLMAAPPSPWTERGEPFEAKIVPWPPGLAEEAFFDRFEVFGGMVGR